MRKDAHSPSFLVMVSRVLENVSNMARILIYEKSVKNPWVFSPGAELPYGDVLFSVYGVLKNTQSG
jgi:hypothetical protein